MLLAMKELAGFDVIHFHEYRTVQNALIHRFAQRYGIPYVLQAHGSLLRRVTKQKLKRIYDELWGYRLLRDATKVIALTIAEAEQYRSMGLAEDKVEVVPNGIDLSEFANLPERGRFRAQWGFGDNQKVVLYLGRLHKTKGLDLLAEAFADLSKLLDDVKLVIAGPDDGNLPALKGLIKELKMEEKVLLTGPLYGRDKLEAYVDADVHVSPRAWEPFGLTLIEACACGTPVICCAGCGIADVIDGQVGLAVPYDRDQLSNAILRMLRDEQMRREFGNKGKLLAHERFDWAKIADQVERIYLSCISTKHLD